MSQSLPNALPDAAPTRRAFFSWLWAAAMAVTAWTGARFLGRTALPRPAPGQRGGIVALGALDALPVAGDAPLANPAGRFFLVDTGEGLLALDQTCTHLDCLLAWSEQTGEFVCPCHGSRFAADGALLTGPAPRDMDRFPIQVTGPDGAIAAATDATTGAPLVVSSYTGNAENAAAYDLSVDTSVPIEGSRPG